MVPPPKRLIKDDTPVGHGGQSGQNHVREEPLASKIARDVPKKHSVPDSLN